MNNKYFVPEIEDFFIGYECETREWKDSKFYKTIIDENLYFTDSDGIYKNNCPLFKNYKDLFRTPYLTKEQIEQEGWKLVWNDSVGDSEEFSYEKNNIILQFYPKRKLNIGITKNKNTFQYIIKSINEFRKLLKMLEI